MWDTKFHKKPPIINTFEHKLSENFFDDFDFVKYGNNTKAAHVVIFDQEVTTVKYESSTLVKYARHSQSWTEQEMHTEEQFRIKSEIKMTESRGER